MRLAISMSVLLLGVSLGIAGPMTGLASADERVTVKPGGPAVSVSLAPGQNGIATFAGKRGNIGVTATIEDLRQYDYSYEELCVTLQDASGRSVQSACQKYRDAGKPFAFTANLTLDGNYRVWLVPNQTFAGTISVKVNVPKRVTVKPGGPAVPVTLAPGQNGLALFSGKKGNVGITATIDDLRQYDYSYEQLCVYLQDSSDRTIQQTCQPYRDAGTPFAFTVNLPRDGKYRVWLVPNQTFAGTISVKVNVPKRVSVKPGGPAASVSLAPGQNGLATFAGKKGNIGVTASITDLRQYDYSYEQLCVYLQDTSDRTIQQACQPYRDAGTPFAFRADLPRDGSYRVWIVPNQTFSGTVSVRLR